STCRSSATDTAPAPPARGPHDATADSLTVYAARSSLLSVGRSVKLTQQRDHFHGGHGGFGALVAGLGAGAFDGLFNGVDGQHAVGHRRIELQLQPSQR